MSSESKPGVKSARKLALFCCLIIASATPSQALDQDPNIPYEVSEPSDEAQLTRSYSIAPHDGRAPSDAYKHETKSAAIKWRTELKGDV